jgi:hypothetical protein
MSLLIRLPASCKSDKPVNCGRDLSRAADRAPHSGEASTTREHLELVNAAKNGSLVTVIAPKTEQPTCRGRVQLAIAGLFRAQPDRVFTVVDLAKAIHGEATRTTCKTIRRAADDVALEMNWMRRKMFGRVDYVRYEAVVRMTREKTERYNRRVEAQR